MRDILRNAIATLYTLVVNLMRWWFALSKASWQQEIRRFGNRKDKWVHLALCVVFSVLLFPYLTSEAFSSSFMIGMSFLWSALVAISLGYILRHPALLILVFVGVFLGREGVNLLMTAKESTINGDFIGSLILLVFGFYLIFEANRIKSGSMFIE
jgi:hypothetical protein